jgi:hypothetical protein
LVSVIKHFDKYPLITFKLADYLLFKEVVGMIQLKEHLTKDGLDKIVAIKASINRGLSQSEELKTAFPHVIPVNRPLVTLPALEAKKTFDPNWLAGFTSGEGCFILNLFKSSAYKTGFKVQLRFQITQHSRDEALFRSLIEYFGCGNVYFREGAVDFIVQKSSDLDSKIIPFFHKYPIVGEKSLNFKDFCQVVELIKQKKHLTQSGLDLILKIKEGFNTKRSK